MTTQPARPNSNTYWVIPGRLLAGEYPGAPSQSQAQAKLAAFLDCGIDAFIDLTHSHELEPYAHLLDALAGERGMGVEHRRFTIQDMGTPSDPSHMQAILTQIDTWLADGRNVYVHCWGGIGRTGTVIGCYLAGQGYPGDQALHRMEELWLGVSADKRRRYPRSPQTTEQENYVRQWPASSSPITFR